MLIGKQAHRAMH